jgi:hypothetical protein
MKKAEMFRDRALKIAESFDAIKKNPLNFNVLMAHVGILSLSMDELLKEYADMLDIMNESNKPQHDQDDQ